MERCDACEIMFPDKIWLDKHKLSPQHIRMQQLMDSDHNYAVLPEFSSNAASAAGRGIGRKIGSTSATAIRSGTMNHNYGRDTARPSTSNNFKQVDRMKMMAACPSKKQRLPIEPGSRVNNNSRPQDIMRFHEGMKGSMQKNPSGAGGSNSVRGRAFVVPPNRQRTTGGHTIDRLAAPGAPQIGSEPHNTTARIPARKIRGMVGQRNECAAGSQWKTFPQVPGEAPRGNQRATGSLKQATLPAPGKLPCPDISQNLREMRSNITMQISQSANHKVSFDQVNKDAFCSVVSKKMQLALERQHESYRARDFFLPPPKKLVPAAAAGRVEKAGKVPTHKKIPIPNNHFTPLNSPPVRGNGLYGSPNQLFSGKAIPSTSSAMRAYMTSAAPAFAAGRREVVAKVPAPFSKARGAPGNVPHQKTSPNRANNLNPIHPSPKNVEGNQSSSTGRPTKVPLGRVVTPTLLAMETDTNSPASTVATESVSDREGDVVVATSATASSFIAQEGGGITPPQMRSPNHDYSLNLITNSSNEKSTKLATEQVATFKSSATVINIKSAASAASREGDAVADVTASPFKEREDDKTAPPQNLSPTLDYTLNPIQSFAKDMEEDRSSSNENCTQLAPEPVVTSTPPSGMKTNIQSTVCVVGSEVEVLTSAAESAPSNTKEDGGKASPLQNSSDQATNPVPGEIVTSPSTVFDIAGRTSKKSATTAASSSARREERPAKRAKESAARIPSKTQRVGRKVPARKKGRNVANRFNPKQASSKKGKGVSSSPKAKSTKRSRGIPWLSASRRRRREEVVRKSTATAPKRIASRKLTKGRKRVRKVTLKQLKDYVPTMPGTDYKMPSLNAIGSYSNEEGNQMWICLVCSKTEPMKSSKPMVCCEICNDWYHFTCVGIIHQMPKKDPWYCKRCIHRSSVRKT